MNKRLLLLFYLRQRRKRKQKYRKKYWIRDILRSCFLLGEYHTLVNKMRENDHKSFYKYFRMTPERFDHLLLLVGPMLTKKSLNMALTWQEMSCDKIQGLQLVKFLRKRKRPAAKKLKPVQLLLRRLRTLRTYNVRKF